MSKTFSQTDFTGGLNQQNDLTKQRVNSNYFVSNVRTRANRYESIKMPKDLSNLLPRGHIQGIVGAGSIIVVFIKGNAYFRDIRLNEKFFQVKNFKMSESANKIYSVIVPASTINSRRVYSETLNTVILANFNSQNFQSSFQSGLSPLPACLVCQDGTSQPWLIFPDGYSRPASNYNQWSINNREYVPIGLNMFYDTNTGKFAVVAPNQTEIYWSVTGRPVDFVIPVDIGGNKLPNVNDGGAASVSDKVDFNRITCIGGINTGEGIFVSTEFSAYFVSPNFDRTIWGEPTWNHAPLFDTGAVNQYSTAGVGNDFAFIDEGGIRNFNATRQTKRESNNEPLSSVVYRLFEGVLQDSPCCTAANDYTYFSVKTKYGFGILVWDNFLNAFVSFDQYDGIGQITQFVQLKVDKERQIYFIADDKLFQMEKGDVTATAKVYFGDFFQTAAGGAMKPITVYLNFTDCTEDGTVNVDVYMDGVRQDLMSQSLELTKRREIDKIVDDTNFVSVPFNNATDVDGQNLSLSFDLSSEGFRAGAFVTWNCRANLVNFAFELDDIVSQRVSITQQPTIHANSRK